MPDFSYEKKLWKKGFKVVAGMDEVGRGSWVGPVVAACVVFLPTTNNQLPATIILNDSKKLSAKQREKADKWIKDNCLAWGIGEASVTAINRLGLTKASHVAFRKAVRGCKGRLASQGLTWEASKTNKTDRASLQGVSLQNKIDFLLLDAFHLPYTKGIKRKNQLAIVKGDSKSYSIAAASIIAKVYRDKLIEKMGERYPQYRWDKNKGYGTKDHQQAILTHGVTRLHRKMFVRKLLGSRIEN